MLAAVFRGDFEMTDGKTLSELLNDEFRLLSRRTSQPLRAKNTDQAKCFGISPSQLSRIRHGKAALTRDNAVRFAKCLRPDESDEIETKKLVDKLVDAADTATSVSRTPESAAEIEVLGQLVSLRNVGELFERLGNNGRILCVEYRDIPRSARGQKYPKYAELAGTAVAKGLCFAMFQPFGLFSFDDVPTKKKATKASKQLHTERVRSYLKDLQHEVRSVHGTMLDAAIRAAERMGMSEAEAKKDIPPRLVLYERDSDEFVGSGFQSRLFYAEIKKEWSVDREVWEWIAAAHGPDLFVRRDVPETVIADQFFPIVSFWREKNRLPHDNDLTSATTKYAREAEANMSKCPWRVYKGIKNHAK
jgi:hypothetical protein